MIFQFSSIFHQLLKLKFITIFLITYKSRKKFTEKVLFFIPQSIFIYFYVWALIEEKRSFPLKSKERKFPFALNLEKKILPAKKIMHFVMVRYRESTCILFSFSPNWNLASWWFVEFFSFCSSVRTEIFHENFFSCTKF